MLVEIRVPKVPAPAGRSRSSSGGRQDWAIVGVAAVTVDGRTQISLVNMGSTTLRATAVEEAAAEGASAADAAELATEGTERPPT